MGKIVEIGKSIVQILFGFLYFPVIFKRLKSEEDRNADLEKRLLDAQETIRKLSTDFQSKTDALSGRVKNTEAEIAKTPELRRRLQDAENEIAKTPELRRRLRDAEEGIVGIGRAIHQLPAPEEVLKLKTDLDQRLQSVEAVIRESRPDVLRRLQALEDAIREFRPDMQRRMQSVEDAIREFRPDIQRRMQTVEDIIREFRPDMQRRMQTVEDIIRAKLANQPTYREVSAKLLPADCRCQHVLGRKTSLPKKKKKPRVLVDVSQLLITNGRSGIQRVVIRILDAMMEDSRCLYVPVGLYKGNMHYVEYHQDEGQFYIGVQLEVMPKDTLLMLDSSWEFCDLFAKTYAQVHAEGGKIYFIVHDLIPLLQSQFCTEVMAKVYASWLVDSVKHADGIMCASKTVAGQLKKYIEDKKLEHLADPLLIGHFVEGADFIDVTDSEPDPKLTEIFEKFKDKKKFLSVATLEPRKNHGFMLDVMDELWKRGYDIVYFIVGRQGWNVESLVERISNHPELNKRLFWFKFLEDIDLQQIYQKSDILLNLSHGEGFGLPLVEGAHYQCSIIASDIPVFREVITDDTTLFCNIDSLDETVDAIADKLDKGEFVPSAAKYYLWSDALTSMLHCIQEKGWDYQA